MSLLYPKCPLLFVMALKGDPQFAENLPGCFKNDLKNENFMYSFCSKYYNSSIITPLCVITEECNNSDTKLSENITGCFKNDKSNLVNFSQAVESLKTSNFISLFFFIS